MNSIDRIRITKMEESCQRTTFYVELTTSEGFTMTPNGHRTGSLYTNFEGLSYEEARDRALIDAANWGDFLQLPVEPFEDQGEIIEPSMTFETYETRRELANRARLRKE